MTAKFIVADVFDGLATLEDGSVDLVITSPPFLALRSYLPADHPDKSKEIGSESTPAEFIDVMLKVTKELRRVLAPHGSICIELGDTYAGSGGAGGDYAPDGLRDGQLLFRQDAKGRGQRNDNGQRRPGTDWPGWPLSKSRTLIPSLYEIALAYGINPLTGQESPAGQWRIRNIITWARPNPPVGALGDKWRPATSDLIVACTSPKRYWDDLATRQPYKPNHGRQGEALSGPKAATAPQDKQGSGITTRVDHPSGAPLLDYWVIPPGGYQGAHYAVFPQELVVPCIQAMAPPKVCRTCGQPSRRIVKQENHLEERAALAAHIKAQREAKGLSRADLAPHFPHYKNADTVQAQLSNWENGTKEVPSLASWTILLDLLDLSDEFAHLIEGTRQWSELAVTDRYREQKAKARAVGWTKPEANGTLANAKQAATVGWEDGTPISRETITLGWSDCGHDNWRPALILDPFAGSGTTLAVATGFGHDAVGIDLDSRNEALARDRVGPFLFEPVEV